MTRVVTTVLCAVLFFACLAVFNMGNNLTVAQELGAISITNNSEFTTAKGVSAGRGTSDQPFIINPKSVDKIYVQNTNSAFVVKAVNIESIQLRNVTNGRIYQCNISSLQTAVTLESCSDITISRNNIDGNWYPHYNGVRQALKIVDSKDIEILANIISRGSDGIRLDDSSFCTIGGNEISGCFDAIYSGKGPADTGSSCTNHLIELNYIHDNGNGIRITTQLTTIKNNIISSNCLPEYAEDINRGGSGIDLTGSALIEGNIITSNIWGISLQQGTATVRNNVISKNFNNGVTTGGAICTVENNYIDSNGLNIKMPSWTLGNRAQEGLDGYPDCGGISISSQCTVTKNEIGNNLNGVILCENEFMGQSLVYENLIQNSKQQQASVVISIGKTSFDNGVRGNYWSDYSGLSQSGGNSSGPYLISNATIDNYPLLSLPTMVNPHRVIFISPINQILEEGEFFSVVGIITPSKQTIIDITYVRPDGSSYNKTVLSDGNGVFGDSVQANNVGLWEIMAASAGNQVEDRASSNILTLEVTETPSSVPNPSPEPTSPPTPMPSPNPSESPSSGLIFPPEALYAGTVMAVVSLIAVTIYAYRNQKKERRAS